MDVKQIEEFVTYDLPISHSVVVRGNHGTGKSAIVNRVVRRAVAKRFKEDYDKVAVVDLRASQKDPTDVSGALFEIAGMTHSTPPAWFPVHKESLDKLNNVYRQVGKEIIPLETAKYGIIFLDEFNRANPMTRGAFFELILDRRINGVKIPDTWFIFAAINDNEDLYEVGSLEPAEADRLVQIQFTPSPEDFLSYLQERTNLGEVHPAIRSYCLRYIREIDPSDQEIEKAMADGDTTQSRRSFDRLGEAWALAASQGRDPAKRLNEDNYVYYKDICCGYLGPKVGVKFLEYVKMDYRTITPADVLDKFDDNAKEIVRGMVGDEALTGVAKNTPALAGLSRAVSDLIATRIEEGQVTSPTNRKNITEFLDMLPRELVTGFWNGWQSVEPKGARDWYRVLRNTNIITRSLLKEDAYKTFVREMEELGFDDVTAEVLFEN